jgi:hypothetical protein
LEDWKKDTRTNSEDSLPHLNILASSSSLRPNCDLAWRLFT